MKIDVIVDTICPWCYIGKRRLDRALATRPELAVEIGWRPFQLNPEMPAGGRDRKSYLAQKFCGIERARQRYVSITEAGAQEGIDFQFDRIERTPNTIASHRLILRAGRAGLQAAAIDGVFDAYFTQGRDIGDANVLAEIGAAAGLDPASLRAYLDGEDDVEHIVAEDEMARSIGIGGVPCFIIDRKYAVSGAQAPEVFHQVFDLVLQDRREVAAE
ncbi:MAG: DsbA family oxidoreductase [Alphaproteobacteria bacterium]|nr:DsbA family oxidoreductase [Alphaproteobacteria bacterium]